MTSVGVNPQTILDDDNPVTEQGQAAAIVVRLSRTTTGARTYTVGMAIPPDETPEAYVDALFEIERLVVARIEKPPKRERGESLQAQLRRSIIVEAMRKHGATNEDKVGSGWATTGEIVNHVKGHRSQVQGDLQALVKLGQVEYERGKGGLYPSRYRLAAPKAQKGEKA